MTDHRRAHVLTGGGTGAVDKVDGAGLAAGDTIQCINSTGIYTYINVQDSAVESIPDVIRPDTNPGTNSWHLFSLIPPVSHVRAILSSSQTIVSATPTPLIFDDEEYDLLNEYDHTTGLFTPIYSGKYEIKSSIWYLAYAWAAGNTVDLFLDQGGTIISYAPRETAWGTTVVTMKSSFNTTINLTASTAYGIETQHSRGINSDVRGDADGKFSYLSIDRKL